MQLHYHCQFVLTDNFFGRANALEYELRDRHANHNNQMSCYVKLSTCVYKLVFPSLSSVSFGNWTSVESSTCALVLDGSAPIPSDAGAE